MLGSHLVEKPLTWHMRYSSPFLSGALLRVRVRVRGRDRGRGRVRVRGRGRVRDRGRGRVRVRVRVKIRVRVRNVVRGWPSHMVFFSPSYAFQSLLKPTFRPSRLPTRSLPSSPP